MPNPCLFAICRTLQKDINSLIHMYYIFNYKIYRYQYFKEKTKCHYMGATHATSLKPTLGVTYLSHPRHFYMGATWVRQGATFCFLRSFIFYLIDLLLLTFCRMSHPCFYFLKIQKTRNNG